VPKPDTIAAPSRYLDALARQDTVIHRLDPRGKVITTCAFVLAVVSFGKYEVSAQFPFLLYPVVLASMGHLPGRYLLRQLLIVSPFAVLVGVFNPLLDREVLVLLGPWEVAGGWVSFASIMMRFILTVSASLVLVGTTGLDSICLALSRLKVPRAFVVQLMLVYRYLFVLGDEARRLTMAHALRGGSPRRISFKVFRSLAGGLLVRAIDRAHRVYVAMLCRGFNGDIRMMRPLRFRAMDAALVAGWVVFFALARYINLARALGETATGLIG
jgi:cobalt/nickel transport system permease protein